MGDLQAYIRTGRYAVTVSARRKSLYPGHGGGPAIMGYACRRASSASVKLTGFPAVQGKDWETHAIPGTCPWPPKGCASCWSAAKKPPIRGSIRVSPCSTTSPSSSTNGQTHPQPLPHQNPGRRPDHGNQTPSSAPRKAVVIALADRDFDPTEVAVPWQTLKNAGYAVVFATATGSPAACDPLVLAGPLFGQLGATKANVALYRQLEADPAFCAPIRYDAIAPPRSPG